MTLSLRYGLYPFWVLCASMVFLEFGLIIFIGSIGLIARIIKLLFGREVEGCFYLVFFVSFFLFFIFILMCGQLFKLSVRDVLVL